MKKTSRRTLTIVIEEFVTESLKVLKEDMKLKIDLFNKYFSSRYHCDLDGKKLLNIDKLPDYRYIANHRVSNIPRDLIRFRTKSNTHESLKSRLDSNIKLMSFRIVDSFMLRKLMKLILRKQFISSSYFFLSQDLTFQYSVVILLQIFRGRYGDDRYSTRDRLR